MEKSLLFQIQQWACSEYTLEHQCWSQDGWARVNLCDMTTDNRLGSDGRFGYGNNLDPGQGTLSIEMEGSSWLDYGLLCPPLGHILDNLDDGSQV